jgi:hypothetical protein
MHASLNINTPRGAASWLAALTAFWGCRRLGELLIRSLSKFLVLRDTCRCTQVSRSFVNGHAVRCIKLVWAKTTAMAGGECILTAVLGPDADLCPIVAWDYHKRINQTPPPNTPLFSFRSGSTWEVLMKDSFLKSSAAVFLSAQLDQVFGHSYHISGLLELLLVGVALEVIMKLGGWTSLCFLIYWRRLQSILPLAITHAWDVRIRGFATVHRHPVDVDALSFND